MFNQKSKIQSNAVSKKLCFYTSIKGTMNKLMKSYVGHQFCWPGCNSKYISETERNLCVQLEEHATDNSSLVFNHLSNCQN